MKRTFLLAGLFAAYVWAAVHGVVSDALQRDRFDPFLPLARRVEQLVEERKFADALPIARNLSNTYPREPLVVYWIARIQNGLGDRAAEAAAWEHYLDLSTTPSEACPALPQAYQATGKSDAALAAYGRCAKFDPDDPDRLTDLGDAQLQANQRSEALATFKRAAVLDPDNPLLARRLQSASEKP